MKNRFNAGDIIVENPVFDTGVNVYYLVKGVRTVGWDIRYELYHIDSGKTYTNSSVQHIDMCFTKV